MERGALIGGIAVVGLLALFAAAFVMAGVGTDTGPELPPAPARQENVANQVRASFDGNGTPRSERRVVKNAEGVDIVVDANGEPVPDAEPEGLGAEKWAELLAQRNAERETRARSVVDAFAADMSESDASRFRDIMERVYRDSVTIREDAKAGKYDRKGQSDALAQLRADTIEDLTTLLGGEKFSQLRTELRRADATWF
ncbi:MAG: hypothetical protein H6737_02165 [Alphaproteobacteria bacterium]|nr:hypothetical protein [Alphaproteobacteria bacterium]